MTLGDFIIETIHEVLAEESQAVVKDFPSLKKRGSSKKTTQKRRLVTEKAIIEAFESGQGYEQSPDDLLTPSAQDALKRYQNS